MTNQTLDGGTNNNVNSLFWIIGIVALLWNLMGLGAFFMSLSMSEESLALLSEAQRAEYEATPMWVTVAFGVATIAGTLGCIALLMKKKWAVLIFLISLMAVIVQFAFGVIGSNAVKEGGATALIMPIVVILIAGGLWYYARNCEAKGWLS